ncbi:energy transducer TonB [Methylorubrum sp. SB2]|uniref:energy transducer TonB n=1 Tax=Methylorubrum subtropicum TaxID=3138812 RepID=UPI00313AEA98
MIKALSVPLAILMLASNGPASAETFDEWRRSLAEHIRCHLVYPHGPGRPDSPRTARVVFNVGANGALSDVNIEQSSGVMVFDRAALAAVESSTPAPPPPPDIRLPITAILPLRFDPPPKAPLSAPSQVETPRPDEAKKELPVCRDIGIM